MRLMVVFKNLPEPLYIENVDRYGMEEGVFYYKKGRDCGLFPKENIVYFGLPVDYEFYAGFLDD